MASEGDIQFRLGLHLADLQKGLQQAGDQVRGATQQMKSQFEGLQGALGKLNVAFAAIGTALAGGAAFKAAVTDTVNFTKEANGLAKTLGITATEASVLNVAIGDVYGTADQVIGAAMRIQKSLGEDEQAFKALGVATRESNGNFRNSLDIMLDVNKRLLTFKEGTDRNVEGIRIYKKAWQDVQPVLRLTTDLMEESRKKAEALGMLVGEETKEQVSRYRAAMNDANDVMKAMWQAIGRALMPELTNLANWFASVGPTAVEYTKVGIYNLIVAKKALILTLKNLWEAARYTFSQIANLAVGLGTGMAALIRWDFSGAKEAFSKMLGSMQGEASKFWSTLNSNQAKYNEEAAATYERMNRKGDTPITARSGGLAGEGGKGKEAPAKSRMHQWEADLAELKLQAQEKAQAEGTFFEFSKQKEAEFWQQKKALAGKGTLEYDGVRKRAADAERAVMQIAFGAKLEHMKAEEEAIRHNFNAKIEIAEREAEIIGQKYGKGSKEYEEAQKHINELNRQSVDQMRALMALRLDIMRDEALGELDLEERHAQTLYDRQMIDQAQLLAARRSFADQRLEIEAQDIARRLQLKADDPDSDPVEREKLEAKLLEIRRKYKAKILEIDSQKPVNAWQSMLDGMKTGLAGFGTDLLINFTSVGDAFNKLMKTMYATFVNEFIIKKGVTLAANAVKESAIYKWLAGEQIQQQMIGSTGVVAAKTAETTTVVAENAVAGATGAAASQASIPYIGPILAIAAAAAMLSQIKGMRSARDGFDIPAGLNPVTQLHAREMVLPEAQADVIRGLANGGGSGGSTTNIIYAMDGHDVERVLMRHPGAVMKAANKAVADGWTPRR